MVGFRSNDEGDYFNRLLKKPNGVMTVLSSSMWAILNRINYSRAKKSLGFTIDFKLS